MQHSPNPTHNISQTDHSGTFGLEGGQEYSQNFQNELFVNLKKNYEERIQELEHHIRETYQLIENDEIIQTMQMNQVSNEFKQQRIREIIEDSLGGEKEEQIEKLNHANAILKTELTRIDQENQKIVQVYNQEVAKFNKTISDFKNALQIELQSKNQLQQECDKLSNKLNVLMQQNEDIVRQKGGTESQLQNEMNRLVQESQSIKKQRDEIEKMNKQKDNIIEEMRKDMEKLKDEYIELETANQALNADQNEFADILAVFKEKKIQDEAEIQRLREIVRKGEEDVRNTKQELDRTLQENADLIAKSEYISSQVKKLVETGQKNTNEMIEEVKQKYKVKMDEQKRKMDEANTANESLKNEVFELRNEIEENKLNHERLVAQFQSDLKLVKSEWAKKCQEIELKAQKEMGEALTKHQENLSKLQIEYHNTIQKKVKEAKDEARDEIAQIRMIEKETRAQLDAKVSRFEKDYMLKATHESTLAAEVLNLKTHHMQEIKELEERFERDYTAKLREISEKNKLEYESSLASLKGQNKTLEQQVQHLKSENQKVMELARSEKEIAQKLQIELGEIRLADEGLGQELEDAKQNLQRVKGLYDEEVRKGKKRELEIEDVITKAEITRRKEGEFNQMLNAGKEEIAQLKDQLASQNQRLSQAINQGKTLQEEIGILRITLEASETEKKSLLIRVAELECDLTAAQEREAENQASGANKMQEALGQAEGKVRTLIKELNAKEENISLLHKDIKELKENLVKSQDHAADLEVEVEKTRGAYKQLERELEMIELAQKKKIAESLRFVYRELGTLRQQMNRLKSGYKVEIEHSKDVMRELMLDLEQEVKEKTKQWNSRKRDAETSNEQRRQHEEERIREEYDRDREDYEKRLERYEREKRELIRETQGLKREAQEAWGKLEDAIKKIGEYEKTIKQLEEGESRLMEESSRKVEEFKNFQEFVQKELKRIKEESENGVKQMVWKHKQEITRIMVNIEDLKVRRVDKMGELNEEVDRMQKEFQKNMEEMKAWYEKKMRDYERNAEENGEELRELRNELANAEEMNERLKEDNRNMMDSLEDKLRVVRDVMSRDKEKQNHDRIQEGIETERLRHTVRDLMVENSVKEDKIKELTKMVGMYGEEKSRMVTTDKDWEVIEVKKHREREMEELQNLLAKTMNEVGRKSFRVAERDTQDTGRRKGSAMRGKDSGKSFEKIEDTYDH